MNRPAPALPPRPSAPVRLAAFMLAALVLAALLARPAGAQFWRNWFGGSDRDGAAEEQAAETPPDPANRPYTVAIAPTGNASLDTALGEASRLVQLREQAPTTPFGLVARAAEDRERMARALHSEGYWGGAVDIRIGGTPLGTPGLADRLESLPRDAPIPVEIAAEPGPLYTIGQVEVRADRAAAAPAVAAATEGGFGLAPGDPAAAAPVLAAEARLRQALFDAGYPLARVEGRRAVVDYDRRSMDVTWTLAPGPRAHFAPPAVAGTERVDPAFLARFARQQLGAGVYSPKRLEDTRRRILALGPFGSVRAVVPDRLNDAGELPVTFEVTERPRRAFGATLAYETNYGPSVRVFWEHRNLFGQAERLRLEGEVARLGSGGNVSTDSLYRAFATLRVPGLWGRDLSLVNTLGALRERLEAYDRDGIVASAILEQRHSERLTYGAGPLVDIGRDGPTGGPLTDYQVLGVALNLRWDDSNSLLDPTRGLRIIATLTPSYSVQDATPFAPTRVTASTYWDATGDGRGVLALRGSIGSLLGASTTEVPQHLRYFAGGGGSVRGYDYLSIGPRDAQGRLLGGGGVFETSVEWRQRFLQSWGVVGFVDTGSVSSNSVPDTQNFRVGVGLGVRYYTAIGPIRLDAALPLIRQVGSSGYGIYVGIGQAF